MKPICVDCQLEMAPKKTGVAVEEMTASGSYMLRAGDVFACPNCNFEVIAGRPLKPIAEHYEANFDALKAAWQPYCKAWACVRDKKRYELEVCPK